MWKTPWASSRCATPSTSLPPPCTTAWSGPGCPDGWRPTPTPTAASTPLWTTPTTACPLRPCSAPSGRSTPAGRWPLCSAVPEKRRTTAAGIWARPPATGATGSISPRRTVGRRTPWTSAGRSLLTWRRRAVLSASSPTAERPSVRRCWTAPDPRCCSSPAKGGRPARSGGPPISTPPPMWSMSRPFSRSTTCAGGWTGRALPGPCCPSSPPWRPGGRSSGWSAAPPVKRRPQPGTPQP